MKKNNSTRHWQKNGGTAASGFSNDREMRKAFAKYLQACRRLDFFHRGFGLSYNEMAFGFSAGFRAGKNCTN